MNKAVSIKLTPKEIKADAEQIVREDFNMSISDFVKSVQLGKLDRYDKRVKELLFWIEALPEGKNLVGQATR
jgi:hypothetical protein